MLCYRPQLRHDESRPAKAACCTMVFAACSTGCGCAAHSDSCIGTVARGVTACLSCQTSLVACSIPAATMVEGMLHYCKRPSIGG